MRLSTGKLQYNENGTFVSINEEISSDVNKVGTPSRSNWSREGFYINETIDSITINFKRGYNKILDSISKHDEIELKLNTGAVIYQGTFLVSEKFNTKPQGQEYTNTYILFTFPVYKLDGTINEMAIKSTAQGTSSGVQDVQIDGTSIVDEDTGVANITTLTTKSEFETATEKVTEALTSLENYCDALDATKLDTISYIELSGKSGTLTDEQRATLLSGSPTLNYIDKDGMIFKCVFYSAGSKAVYSIGGESKIHVITVTLPAGTWALVTYELAQPYTAGDNITIKNNVISATSQEPDAYLKTIAKTDDGVVTITDKDGTATTFQTGGGSGGGVSQTYVDTQDQAILETATERIDAEGTERATMDSTLSEAILNETDKRTEADATLQSNIDNEAVTRTTADAKLEAALDSKLDKQTPGYRAIYGVTKAGDQYTFPYSMDDATDNTVVGRNSNGQIYCESPTEAKHAVNYEYFWGNLPDSQSRFGYDFEYDTSEGGSWVRDMEFYAPNERGWLVLDCGKEATNGSKPLYFSDDKMYWGNDRFEYEYTSPLRMAQFTWDGYLYRVAWNPGTKCFRVLTYCPDKKMFAIGI